MSGVLSGVALLPSPAAHATSVAHSALINGDSVTTADGITDSSSIPISLEQFAAQQAGYTVTVVTGAQWDAMTAAQFAQYQLLIVGDPFCNFTPASATSNASTWVPVVMGTSGLNTTVGNRVVVGTDPEDHYADGGGGASPTNPADPTTAGAEHLVQDGITYAGGVSGATGVYFDTSCADLGSDVSVLNSLSATGTGFTEDTSPPCGGSVQLIASNPVFSSLSDTDIQGWGCSDHITFPTYPTDWQPLTVATDTATTPTCGTDPNTATTACGESYVLLAGQGIVVTAPDLTLTPATNSDPAGGSHTVTATVTQAGSPSSGQLVSFAVTGQNGGASGTCVPVACTTNASGQVTFTYSDGKGAGMDTIDASITVSGTTEHATASETWTAPTLTSTSVVTSLSGAGLSGTSISVPMNTEVTDSATLSGTNAASASGTVAYSVFSDSGCKTAVSTGSAQNITTSGTLPASAPVSLTSTGTYYWQASYSGDTANLPSTSACGSEVETVTKSTSPQPTKLTTSLLGAAIFGGKWCWWVGDTVIVFSGTPVTDSATLRGANVSTAGGTVTYTVYSDFWHKHAMASGGTVTVHNGVVPNSNALTLPRGTYYWQATYSGDALDAPSASKIGSEIELVVPQPVCPSRGGKGDKSSFGGSGKGGKSGPSGPSGFCGSGGSHSGIWSGGGDRGY
jgi:uncharacterized membrane protein YgcG